MSSKEEYSGVTKYLSTILPQKSQYGQFFTPFSIVDLCITKCIELSGKKFSHILEPSCGPLQFILKIDNLLQYDHIDAYELDQVIYEDIKDNYIQNLTIYNEDFILHNTNYRGYDLIIGNPPYVELSDYPYKYKKTSCSTGRYNIYGMFIEKCIDLLAENGLLCFVLPLSLVSAPSFHKLRKLITDTCNIEYIINLNNFSNEVSQDVGIYIFRKVHSDKRTRDYIGDNSCFSYERYSQADTPTLRIKDIAKVSTGNIVWNQHRDKLCTSGTLRLIYSNDIGNIQSGKLSADSQKFPFIKTDKSSITLPAIFANRNKGFKYEFVDEDSDLQLIAENHVNVIVSDRENLLKIISTFETQKFRDYVRTMTSTLNFSKTQLENVPLFS